MNFVWKDAAKLGVGLVVLMAVTGCASTGGSPRSTLDPDSGQFAPCPNSPNCVSTGATDEEHGIQPYSFTGSASDAKARMIAIVEAMPRSKVVADEGSYLHAEFRSRLFRFVDDVEFFFDESTNTVHFRSAARLGKSDLGVNRKRMEEIRSAWNQDQ